MNMDAVSLNTGFGSLSKGQGALNAAKFNQEESKFRTLLESMEAPKENVGITNVSSSQIVGKGHVNGDWKRGFHGAFTSEKDKAALPSGAAANSVNPNVKPVRIDKTSELYEQALEFENYFVKTMLESMRKTVSKTNLFGSENSYAQDMYEDMLYDNYAEELTKKAGFGIADQIYIQMSQNNQA